MIVEWGWVIMGLKVKLPKQILLANLMFFLKTQILSWNMIFAIVVANFEFNSTWNLASPFLQQRGMIMYLWTTHPTKNMKFVSNSFWGYGRCLKVSGRCLEGVWRLSEGVRKVSEKFLEGFLQGTSKTFGRCLVSFWKVFKRCLYFSKNLSARCSVNVWEGIGRCLEVV